MVNKTPDPNNPSRKRILEAARAEFAEKGFDGARVDSIAQRAEVNKALIYYYFKSKDELLQELLRAFLEERRLNRPTDIEGSEHRTLPSRIAEFDVSFLFERRDLLRIALMEDLKASKGGIPGPGTMMRQWLDGLVPAREDYNKAGYGFRYTPRVVAAMYFFHLMPIMSFCALGETLAQSTGIELETLRAEFLKLILEQNGHHYHSVFGNSCTDPAPEVALPGLEPRPPLPEPPEPHPRPQDHLKISAQERAALVAKHMPDGRLEAFPLKEKARVALIDHIAEVFDPSATYTEREVDAILKPIVADHSKARRYLVDYGYLRRTPDGSRYWTWEGTSR